ncbi:MULTISPECIES: YecH family metal-binding protein [unclassified Lentimonas]|uniref:YecH family metal-binding protein n=1 Tax=unclassified Lentimonas TaxID=2630993 RepID=UPI00132998FB|nr:MULTISPECIES: YecH family metal-binding protein [unclassified Lentimonas]CAA6677141.1 Unannotated [Lentimonas sp. CC4]CAA6686235.1 Unannotated [Lentimonas sp. CC6]CAA7074265.1 Unannotated [Lentimonas sp. CC4]CAA7171096.1 Unannotated [Lentimonas sp. CC21]CAA7180906.1 Unannotated [Lentimonas sp. CC8]
MNSTASDIHGHKVIEMMIASGDQYSTERLQAAIDETFGAESKFCTCEEDHLSSKELIELLWTKGKFIGTKDAFTFDTEHKSDCHG